MMKRRIIATLFILSVAIGASGIMLSQYPDIKKKVDNLNEFDYSDNLIRTILAANYAIRYDMQNAASPDEAKLTPSEVYISPAGNSDAHMDGLPLDAKDKQDSTQANAKYVSGSLDTTIQQWDTTLKYNCQNLVYYASDTLTNQVQVSNNAVDTIPNGAILKNYAGKVGTISKSSTDKDGKRYNYQWVLTISYDNDGIATIKNQTSSKVAMTDYMYRSEQDLFLSDNFPIFFNNDENDIYASDVTLSQQEVEQLRTDYRFNGIRNMTFVYAIPEKLVYNDDISGMLGYYDNDYFWSESAVYLLSILAAVIIIALLVPVKLLQDSMIAVEFNKIPLDILAICWFIIIPIFYLAGGIREMMPLTYPERAQHVLNTSNMFFPYAINFIYLFLLYAVAALSVLSFKKAFKLGWKEFFKQTFVYKFFHALKQGMGKLFRYLDQIDLNDSASARLVGIVLANFFLLYIMIFVVPAAFGIFLACVYSLALMFVARCYISRVKKNYRNLLQITKNIANKDLDKDIKQDLGIFNSFKEDITNIRHSFKNAIEEEVKSQKMKTELISNVSHDLKTPLTTIITYTDLLKQEHISDEDRQTYLHTLERNEVRLKHLIEDLFEVSRVNSGDIQLNLQEVDIISLISQILIEHEDMLERQQLIIRTNYSDDKILMTLDPQKTYRILVNIVINISKYAMPKSRVYIDVTDYGEQVELSFKNMSATEITFDPSDIVDRFVRGDKSRSTEGSGLGLAISKSFTEVQGGSFHIDVDGDLFKAVMRFSKK